jgi:hypothetical protein
MALEPSQTLSADVLALRILLGQLIVRIAAGSQDPASVLKVLQDGASKTAANAKLRGLADDKQDEVREYMRLSIERFFSAMRIEKGGAQQAAGAAAPAAPAKSAATSGAPTKGAPGSAAPKAPLKKK